jgi:hypothetical protein
MQPQFFATLTVTCSMLPEIGAQARLSPTARRARANTMPTAVGPPRVSAEETQGGGH